MALADVKRRNIELPLNIRSRRLNVAASTQIFAGAIVALNGSGEAVNAPVAGDLFYVGIADNGFDNSASGSATTDGELLVRNGQIERLTLDTVPTDADIGKVVYYNDDDSVTLTIVPATGIPESQVGIILSVVGVGNDVMVDTEKAISA